MVCFSVVPDSSVVNEGAAVVVVYMMVVRGIGVSGVVEVVFNVAIVKDTVSVVADVMFGAVVFKGYFSCVCWHSNSRRHSCFSHN